MTYGKQNDATLTFLGDGKMKGNFYWNCLGTFDLVGKMRPPSAFCGGVESWKEQYDSINHSS